MLKYHLKNDIPHPCRCSQEECPQGADTEHFEGKRKDVKKWAEAQLDKKLS